MDANKMTYAVQEALQQAIQLAQDYEQQNVEIEAVLLAALKETDSLFNSVLERANIDTSELANAYDSKLKRHATVKGDNIQYGQYIGNETNTLFNKAEAIMKDYDDEFVSMEHVLLAAMEVDETTKSYVGNKNEVIKEIIKKIRGGNHVTSQNPEANYEALEKYGRDLVEEVRQGNMDPVIGRDEEIRNTIRILSRKTKNNPVLIGEPGVGKTAIVEGLAQRIVKKDVPESMKSLEFIRDLLEVVPTSANAKQYATIVREKATLRKLIKVTEDITTECYLGKDDVTEILDHTEKNVFGLLQQASGREEFVPIDKVVLNTLDAIEEAASSAGRVTGIATGFTDLDYKLSGLHPSELIIVAARPAMGKTAFVLNIAQKAAVRDHVPTAIFSLEMSKEQLVTRMMAMEAMVDSQSIRTGDLQETDWEKIMESAGPIGRSPLIIDDTPGITIAELRSKCRRYKQIHGLDLIIIDYLQLMSGGKRSESRQQEISEISRSLKALAREMNAPVIALSQLSRRVEERKPAKPMLSDLRESGSIEQDADVVMFIYRDEYYNEDSEKKGIAEIIVDKQRNGSTGSVELVWLGQYTKFGNKERAPH